MFRFSRNVDVIRIAPDQIERICLLFQFSRDDFHCNF